MSQDKKITPLDTVKKRDQSLDDFWDVDRLLPQKPRQPKYAPVTQRKTPEAVEIEVAPVRKTEEQRSNDTPAIRTVTVPPTGSVPLSFAHGEKTVIPEHESGHADGGQAQAPAKPREEVPSLSYTPDSRLIHRVDVYEWHSNYHYFDQFIKDAVTYAALEGQETRREPFFSYFPQYAQLNRRQRAWYLYWRSQVRAGQYPETDYAYILLYLFELINLPAEGECAELHRDLMAKVWVAYRKTYPQLDHYACEWLCDYCLIHELPAPVVHLLPALGQILSMALLKEFYLSSMIAVGDEQVNLTSARILLSHSCQYDYKKSKFYSGEHQALFDTVIPRALAATFPLLIGDGGSPSRDDARRVVMPDAQVSRDAYVGALCAYGNKRRIKVAYISFSRSHDLRFMVGDMVKHIENRIRASVLIRSRLTTHFLTVPLRKALDTWLDEHLPSPEVAMKKAEMNKPRPEYEALYDLPHTEVSIESADAIEQDSWETTKILVEAFSEEENAPDEICEPVCEAPPVSEMPEPEPVFEPEPSNDSNHPLIDALGDRAEFVRAVLRGDRAGQKAYCTTRKKLPDAVVDEINDLSVEHEIFDTIIEDDGRGGYRVIEDYRDMVAEMLQM